ncbi:MAG: carboxypeptidase regulatory-like domain-containing protein, partial [Acidobacteriaceae bacterium]|nr:carboxypeptidase regulatory-like domain-containing protein [Acidobacteriaceae bacterium]
LTALHDGYFPSAYGQRLPAGHGTPIQVTEDSNFFTELRLRHQGAITGRVLDENGVPVPEVQIYAYRARLPLRSAGIATSDDRGVYRIHGLSPGKYWVRSAPHTFDDSSSWLPTFGPQGREVRDARVHPLSVEIDAQDADVSPEPGALFHLGGTIACDRDGREGAVTITLSSETGRQRIGGSCNDQYRFDHLAPGYYEILATTLDGKAAGFSEMFLDRDSEVGVVQVMQLSSTRVDVYRAGSSVRMPPVTLIGRRQDLSETDSPREFKSPSLMLAPGNWAFRAIPPAGLCVDSISTGSPRRPLQVEHDPDWYEVFIQQRGFVPIRVMLSDQCGQIRGQVLSEGKPSVAAPVFLWPLKESARRALSGPQQALTDTEGHFQFSGLPPGDYRLVASFDINEIDEELIELSHAITVTAVPNQSASADLQVWTAPF